MSNKLFVYEVNGETFEGYEAFGEAWKKAVALAKAEHCGIFRQVVDGDDIRNEFYARGIFLNERSYSPEKLYIF